MDGAPAYGHIVVGVDGSPTSRAALRWAAREAELRRCPLDVVYGWQVKAEPRPPGEWGGVTPPIAAYQQQAQARIQGIVDEELPNGARCELRVQAMHKPAGRALLSSCGTADLLVIGAKEHGRFPGWLVGSTSDEALKNSTCTVVVVRPPAPDGPVEGIPAEGARPEGTPPVGRPTPAGPVDRPEEDMADRPAPGADGHDREEVGG